MFSSESQIGKKWTVRMRSRIPKRSKGDDVSETAIWTRRRPTCHGLRIWEVGSTTYVKVPEQSGREKVVHVDVYDLVLSFRAIRSHFRMGATSWMSHKEQRLSPLRFQKERKLCRKGQQGLQAQWGRRPLCFFLFLFFKTKI